MLTQGSAADEAGRVQGIFATCQTALTAVAAAGAGAAFAAARWLPFVAVAALAGLAMVAVVVIWRPVPGRVERGTHPLTDAPSGPRPVWGESVQLGAPEPLGTPTRSR